MGEFQHHKAPARFENPVGFCNGLIYTRDITNAKGNRIGIKGLIRERQFHRIAAGNFNPVAIAVLFRPLAPNLQHVLINIAQCDL